MSKKSARVSTADEVPQTGGLAMLTPMGESSGESTGTSEKTLAKKILAKKRVLVVEAGTWTRSKFPRRPSSSCATSIGSCGQAQADERSVQHAGDLEEGVWQRASNEADSAED